MPKRKTAQDPYDFPSPKSKKKRMLQKGLKQRKRREGVFADFRKVFGAPAAKPGGKKGGGYR
jgi:hypothetical protein